MNVFRCDLCVLSVLCVGMCFKMQCTQRQLRAAEAAEFKLSHYLIAYPVDMRIASH